MKRIAVIDVDSILYAAACMAETRDLSDGSYLQVKTLEEAYAGVEDKLHALIEKVEAQDAIICLSMPNCFRYKLLPTYKGNRTNHRPDMLRDLQEKLVSTRPYSILQIRGLEADDVAGITACSLNACPGKEAVLCSIDKDLRQIPGLLFQGVKVERITEEYGDRWHLYQALIGDTTDNYTGCPGIGPKKAEAILAKSSDPAERWANVLAAFKGRGYDESYALTQARVSRILRLSDWDALSKEPRLWKPPTKLAVDAASPEVLAA